MGNFCTRISTICSSVRDRFALCWCCKSSPTESDEKQQPGPQPPASPQPPAATKKELSQIEGVLSEVLSELKQLTANITVINSRVKAVEEKTNDSFIVLSEDKRQTQNSTPSADELPTEDSDVCCKKTNKEVDEVPMLQQASLTRADFNAPSRSWIFNSQFAPTQPLTGDRALIFRDDKDVEPAHSTAQGHWGSLFTPGSRDVYHS